MPEIPVLLRPDLREDRRQYELAGREQHHVWRVLRLRRGDALELRDGRGLVGHAHLEQAERHRSRALVDHYQRPPLPAAPALHLALPLLKGRRLDWALEKGCELGVAAFHLYEARRSVVRREEPPPRYHEVIGAAYRQSRRLLLPTLDGPQALASLLAGAREAGWPLYWADETLPESTAGPAAFPHAPLLALVGPEGGLTAAERDLLREAGAEALSLGPTRLRAETAALALTCRILLPPAPPGTETLP